MLSGKCKLEDDKPVCSCPSNFSGSRCEQSLTKDLCSPNPCLNDGECQTDGKGVSCFCPENYTGRNCEIPCNCNPGDICRESLKTPGSAECLTVPPSEILIPDNVSEPPLTMKTIIPKLKSTSQKPTTMEFPTPPSMETQKQTESFSLPPLTNTNSEQLTTTPVPPLELGPFDGLLVSLHTNLFNYCTTKARNPLYSSFERRSWYSCYNTRSRFKTQYLNSRLINYRNNSILNYEQKYRF